MEALEKEFLDIITNIKFRTVRDTFQMKLEKDIPKNSKNQLSKVLFLQTKQVIFLKYTNNNIKNFFMTTSQRHKKAPTELETLTNLEAKTLPSSLTWTTA